MWKALGQWVLVGLLAGRRPFPFTKLPVWRHTWCGRLWGSGCLWVCRLADGHFPSPSSPSGGTADVKGFGAVGAGGSVGWQTAISLHQTPCLGAQLHPRIHAMWDLIVSPWPRSCGSWAVEHPASRGLAPSKARSSWISLVVPSTPRVCRRQGTASFSLLKRCKTSLSGRDLMLVIPISIRFAAISASRSSRLYSKMHWWPRKVWYSWWASDVQPTVNLRMKCQMSWWNKVPGHALNILHWPPFGQQSWST